MSEAYNSEMHVAVGGAWQRAGLRLLRQVEVPADWNILDVGCGTGDLTFALARCVPSGSVVGLDNEPAHIEKAKKAAAKFQLSNIHWEVSDLFAYEPQHTFQLVYSNSTLHLVRPGVAAVVRLARWVAPGGRLAVQLPARELSEEVETAVRSALAVIGADVPFPLWSTPWYLPNGNDLAATVRDAGLTNVRVMEELEPLTFRSGEDVTAYFRGLLLGSYLEALPGNQHEDFLEAFGESFPLDNGMPSCLLKRLYLLGER